MSDPPPAVLGEPGSRRREGLALLACLLVHGLLVGWLLQDALFSGGQRVPGAEDTEVWAFLWGSGWMEHALLVEHRYPQWTDLLDFPQGGSLFLKDPLSLLMTLPAQLALGVPFAHTLRIWLQLVGAGLGCFLVARALGVGRTVAVLAGASFACCPHLLGEAYNGNTEAINGAWCALWLWALLGVVKRPSVGRVVAGGVILAGLLISNQYYALVMAALSGPVLLAALRWERAGETRLARASVGVALTVALGLLLFSPLAWGLLQSMSAPDQLTFLDERVSLEPPWATDLVHLVRPLARLPGQPARVPLQDLVYPGFAVAALGLAAPLLAPRGPWRWLLPAGALALLLLALGPVLMIDGEILRWADGEPIYLPWAYLIPGKPVLGAMTLPHRMMVPAGLLLSLGMGLSIEGLTRRVRSLSRPRLARVLRASLALVLVAAVAEQLAYPPYRIPLASQPAPTPAYAQALAALPHEGAVLDLPLIHGSNHRRIYLWWQAVHGRPVAASLRQGAPPSVVAQLPWLQALLAWEDLSQPPPEVDPALRDALLSLGFGFVVLHQEWVLSPRGAEDVHALRTWIEASLGPGLETPGGHRVWALEPPAAEALEGALGPAG
jgi:hypothetical protein